MAAITELSMEYRPWGYYKILEEDKNYKVKKLVVNPGKRISLQTHKYRNEFWAIVDGNPMIVCGDVCKKYYPGESVFIPKETRHRLENRTDSQITVIEVQNGSYLGENDIQRIEDDYNRTDA